MFHTQSYFCYTIRIFAMKLHRTFFRRCLSLTLCLWLSTAQAQTLRGIVRDADNGDAVIGATVALRFSRAGATPVSLATNPSGEFVFEKIRAGYYSVEITSQGFENQTIAEVNVAAGKEQVLDIALRRSTAQLAEVTISATQPGRRPTLPLGEIPLTRDQTLRFPATFFDPARLAMAYPGVVNTDDQANGLSIRGNSPASLRWRLEGVDIVNPNHLPNAGTFSDRSAAASGGILMFSAQLLDNSSLLTGAFPAGYGDALGGIMDMNLRSGNNRKHEFTAQAGLIGLDLAAEGPIGNKGKNAYLVNYRYSTVGLLGQLGVSFGDEQIHFQDLSFNLNFKGKRGGHWSVFGLGGLSDNIFRHKTDSTEIKAYKDFFDIDFESKTGVLGVSNWSPFGKNSWSKFTVAASGQVTDRTASSPVFQQNSIDDLSESKISATYSISYLINTQFRFNFGTSATRQKFTAISAFENLPMRSPDYSYYLSQTWAQLFWKSVSDNTQANLGVHTMWFKSPFDKQTIRLAEPRGFVSQRFGQHKLLASAGIYSQTLPPWILGASTFDVMRASKVSLAYVWALSPNWSLKAETFYQGVLSAPYSLKHLFSVLNVSEFKLNESYEFIQLDGGGNQGIELSAERRLADGWFLLANATLMDSKFPARNPDLKLELLPSRWDFGHIANVTFGKEWQREKRPGKERTIGLNARAVWMGGVREADINLSASQYQRTTIFEESRGYYRQNPDYYRLDLRVYWRKNLGNRRNSTFALDLQNLTGQQNLAYHYYDPYTDQIETKYQLGTIPNFSWRLEF